MLVLWDSRRILVLQSEWAQMLNDGCLLASRC
jgi:hypothetical protein